MTGTRYAAGSKFIVNRSEQTPEQPDRSTVMRHASRAQWKRRKAVKMRSWINPDRSLELDNKTETALREARSVSNPSFQRVGGDLSALQLPKGIEPAMVQELVRLIDLEKQGLYPYDICLQVHPVETGYMNLQVKVCRADLGLALRLGGRAQLFRDSPSWECFIAERGLIHCDHEPHKAQTQAFLTTLDSRLGSCWRDIHAFSCLSNLAYQTTRKLSPELYNEMMISILYRLMNLSFQHSSLLEVVRTGLLTFCSTIFLTRHYLKQPYEHLFDNFNAALFKRFHPPSIGIPPSIMLWLIILYHMVAQKEPWSDDWQTISLDNAVSRTGLETWPEARIVLKSIMWVDFVHDAPGKKAFDAAIQRLGRHE